MNKIKSEALLCMDKRFGKDNLIALATTVNNRPYVRAVNSFYEDGWFYVITYALSGKMKQLAENSAAAICGDWFTAEAEGVNLGYLKQESNRELYEKLKAAFCEWYNNGDINEDDQNTVILGLKLKKNGVLFSSGKRYDIDFISEFKK